MHPYFSLQGRTALMTGGTRGTGKMIAKANVEAGEYRRGLHDREYHSPEWRVQPLKDRSLRQLLRRTNSSVGAAAGCDLLIFAASCPT